MLHQLERKGIRLGMKIAECAGVPELIRRSYGRTRCLTAGPGIDPFIRRWRVAARTSEQNPNVVLPLSRREARRCVR